MFSLSVYVSKTDRGLGPRLAVMVLIAVIVKSSEYANKLAGENWRSFCTQNYFDSHGVFMTVLVCSPLLLDSLIMLFLFLREASQLLIQVKKRQLKQKRNAKAAQQQKGDGKGKRRSKKEQ
jgi:transmembrane protein 18